MEIQYTGPEESEESIRDLKVRIVAGYTAAYGFPYEKVETWPDSVIDWMFSLAMEQ